MDISELKNIIMKNRPNLKDNTIKNYCSSLKNLYKKIYLDDKVIDIMKFQDTKKFLDYLIKHYVPSVRKTYLSTLVVLTENDEYREKMKEDVVKSQEEKSQNVMNEKQEKNHITNTEVNTLIKSLKDEVTLIYKSQSFTPANLITIQNYILMLLFSGKYIPPRRSMDYFMMKIKNVGNDDNWINDNEFVFNSYKTVATYGQQRIKIPNILLKIIQKYIKVIPESQDYLFFTITGKPLSAVTINQRFNGLFLSKNVSVNAFRHLFLSHKFQKNIQLKSDLANMGSSMNVIDSYIQRGNFK